MTVIESRSSQRRAFLQSLLAAGICALVPSLTQANTQSHNRLASAFKDADGQFGVAVLSKHGEPLRSSLLPDRGHASLFHSHTNQLLTFARRPGRFIHILDLSADNSDQIVESVEGRHFYGHGCFSYDGTTLFATENDYAAVRGVIGIYDVTNNYQRIGEYQSFGVGPHDIRLLNDNRTLLVANGGIETHPNTGREKLNLLDMQSNLAFIDSKTGALIKTTDIKQQYQKLSLRHLAMSASGECYVGGQYQGALEDMSPLAGTITQEGGMDIWDIPREHLLPLKNYISSIEAIPNSPLVVVTSSKGGTVLVWNTKYRRVEKVSKIADVSGIAILGSKLQMSDGAGFLYTIKDEKIAPMDSSPEIRSMHWDNHLMAFAL